MQSLILNGCPNKKGPKFYYDEDEVLETKIFSVSEIKKMLRNNKFSDIKTYISLERFTKSTNGAISLATNFLTSSLQA